MFKEILQEIAHRYSTDVGIITLAFNVMDFSAKSQFIRSLDDDKFSADDKTTLIDKLKSIIDDVHSDLMEKGYSFEESGRGNVFWTKIDTIDGSEDFPYIEDAVMNAYADDEKNANKLKISSAAKP